MNTTCVEAFPSRDGRGKKVLILVHCVPPVPRMLKLVRHLATFGWTPALLAPRRPGHGDRRFEYDSVLSNVAVEETFILPAPESVARRLLAAMRQGQPAKTSAGQVAGVSGSRVRWSLARQLLLWTSTPDEYAGWLPWVLWRGWRLVREKKIDAILASGPPFTVVLAGALLARLTRRPFIADFRDAWVQDPVDPFGCLTGSFRVTLDWRRRTALAFMERRVLAQAGSVLFTSDYTMRAYVRAYPDLVTRGAVLYNGVEESDLTGPGEVSPDFMFTYVGTLHEYQREQVALFLRAFNLALRQKAEMSSCRVRICGQRPAPLEESIGRVAREVGVETQLLREGAVPHARAMALLKGANVLLLFAGTSLFIRPSKLSEYLATRRPILALAAQGSEAATQVERAGHIAYSGNVPDELATIILQFHAVGAASPSSDRPFPFSYPHPLNWKSSSAVVASTLDRLCGFADTSFVPKSLKDGYLEA